MKFATRRDVLAVACFAMLVALSVMVTSLVFDQPTAAYLSISFSLILLSALLIALYRNLMRSIHQTSQSVREMVHAEFHALIGNVQSLLYLQSKMKIASPLPLTGGWAASADFLAFLDNEIRTRKPKLIFELGSGVSTVICTQALKSIGGGRVISIDHNAEFAAKTERFLNENGLSENSEIKICPLKEMRIGEKIYLWYDTSLLNFKGQIDLLIVDGPPQVGGESARYPALHALHDRLAKNCRILVDDGQRVTEKNMVDTWLREFDLISVYISNEKGLFLIRKR